VVIKEKAEKSAEQYEEKGKNLYKVQVG